MQSLYYSLFVLCSVFIHNSSPASVLNNVVDSKQQLFELSLVHFNDFHARFEEISPSASACDPKKAPCIGGFPRLYTKIHELKKLKPQSVVLNAGDSFQGTLWYNIFKWNVTQHFMNMLPLDAHTLGNHEFDDGIAGIVPYIKHLKTKMLVCNIDDKEEPTIQGTYQSSLVIERNNRKIGIIGVILKTTNEIAQTEKLLFTDEIVAIKKEAAALTKQGVNIIIVLSHCGLEVDRLIAQGVGSDVDIIVGGHSHSLLYTGVTPNGEKPVDVYPVVVQADASTKVLIVQAAAFSKFLGNIDVKFDELGKIQSWKGAPIYLENSIEQDPKILELMQPYKVLVDLEGKKVIGVSKVLLSKPACLYGECNIGNLITDSFIEAVVDVKPKPGYWSYAAAGMINQGGIRANIEIGPITYESLVLIQPFNNDLVTAELQGKYIMEAFEVSVSKSWSEDEFVGSNMLQVSGFHVVYNTSKPIGQRLISAKIRCNNCTVPTYAPIDPDTSYRLVMQSYLADGKDGFEIIKQHAKNIEIWGVDLDLLEKYVRKFSPIVTGLEDRIIMLK